MQAYPNDTNTVITRLRSATGTQFKLCSHCEHELLSSNAYRVISEVLDGLLFSCSRSSRLLAAIDRLYLAPNGSKELDSLRAELAVERGMRMKAEFELGTSTAIRPLIQTGEIGVVVMSATDGQTSSGLGRLFLSEGGHVRQKHHILAAVFLAPTSL